MPAELDIVAAENRRLLREVKELRARVAAIESSRWWRLHPRFLLRRRPAAPAGPSAERQWVPAPDEDDRVVHFRAEVVARGSFRADMVSGNFQTWEPLLADLEGKRARILEIGSFEGLSACYFLWRLSDAEVTCIDTFTGGLSLSALGADVADLEQTFDRNLALVDPKRVRKLVGESGEHLPELVRRQETFDLVFVDGSDLALDVIVDAALSWQMLVPGGYMIFDNYGWRSPLGEDPLFHPSSAVDAFLELVRDHCEVLFKRNELIIRRTATQAPAPRRQAVVAADA